MILQYRYCLFICLFNGTYRFYSYIVSNDGMIMNFEFVRTWKQTFVPLSRYSRGVVRAEFA
jgi:hypothetical protein